VRVRGGRPEAVGTAAHGCERRRCDLVWKEEDAEPNGYANRTHSLERRRMNRRLEK
jgi:hypothetical protein